MYGLKNNYFNSENKDFHNSIWIELIGFDKNDVKNSVASYLKNVGFTPDSVSLHLTSVNFVNGYKGMESEYELPPYACSYAGHAENDERPRQNWTNYDLRNLVTELKNNGVEVFASFFDLVTDFSEPFYKQNPEILAQPTSQSNEQGVLMIKRFKNGKYYEDFFISQLIKTVNGYGFNGVQLADGISSPRNAIWFADFSDDVISQSGIIIPNGVDKVKYIQTEKRDEWVQFYRIRWGDFLTKTVNALKENGTLVALNNAWTRDPVEALYRYGIDYNLINKLNIDYFIVEDVSSDLAILSAEDNHGYLFSDAERKNIHYEFLANLMNINAVVTTAKITPLFMIWDNQEQWNVIHHAPTAMQRAATANFSSFIFKNGKYQPVTNGPHFCLGDALSNDDWNFIRLCIDNAYVNDAIKANGATFIVSSNKVYSEVDAFINYGVWHSAKWLSTLLFNGANVYNVCDIISVPKLSGDIVIANYNLLPESEKEIINNYKNGKVIKVEYNTFEDRKNLLTPSAPGWPRPLSFISVPNEYINNKVEEINKSANVIVQYAYGNCTANEVITSNNTSVIFISNNEYYYCLPTVTSKRKIKSIKIITKPNGYPLKRSENSFTVRVAGRGVDVAYVTYK